ncbi:MAG: hypothetical protein JXA68_07505, partial [Ignavibacteriales bacterium]|nr:hypothetical protein [Ignavibacteriales bacterium]
PSSRPSWRVPFGTGKSVTRFLQGTQNEYLLYSPKSFLVLKEWINLFENKELLSPSKYLLLANKIHPALRNFLVEKKFEKDWGKILQNSKSNEQINKQKRLWFDGFKTLKFIHYLRDNAFPQVNMFKAVEELLDNNSIKHNEIEDFSSIGKQIEILNVLRRIA